MNINEIDKFRNDFFDKVIKDAKEKEQIKKLAQKNCFHKYTIIGTITPSGYQERTCSKCEHSAIKSVRVWEGSSRSGGECTIA
jgi:hypothetical protein